jgi:hypothetical protein
MLVLLRIYPYPDVKNAAYYKQKSGGCPLFDAFGIELQKDSSIEAKFMQGLTPYLVIRWAPRFGKEKGESSRDEPDDSPSRS